MNPEIQVLLGLLTLAGVIAGGIIAGIYAERKSRLEATASPYGELRARVNELEKKDRERDAQMEALLDEVRVMRAESQTDRDYIRRVVPWVTAHRDLATWAPPAPPPWITD